MSKAYLPYAAKRLAQAIVVILLAYVFTFVVVSILPGDPITNVLRDPAERVHRGRDQGDHRRPGPGPADPDPAVDIAVPLRDRRSRPVDAVQPARDNPDRRGSPVDAGPRVRGFRRRAAAGGDDRLRHPVSSETIRPGLAAGLPVVVPVGAQLRDRPGADPRLRLPARPLPRDRA